MLLWCVENIEELRKKVMSHQGKNSWNARVKKYGLPRAKEMMKEARAKVGKKDTPQTAS